MEELLSRGSLLTASFFVAVLSSLPGNQGWGTAWKGRGILMALEWAFWLECLIQGDSECDIHLMGLVSDPLLK